MAPAHHLAQMESVPVHLLRGEAFMGVPSGVNAPLVAAMTKWLTMRTGEPPYVTREEPPDQMAGALAQAGNLLALMTLHRAVLAQADGLVYRPLVPTPVLEYGFAYVRNDRSPALANLVDTVTDLAPPLEQALPEGRELLLSEADLDPDSAAV
jgi:hypothetical protein